MGQLRWKALRKANPKNTQDQPKKGNNSMGKKQRMDMIIQKEEIVDGYWTFFYRTWNKDRKKRVDQEPQDQYSKTAEAVQQNPSHWNK